MSKYRVEYVTPAECEIVEGEGAWCVIERKRTHDEVISQHGTEQDATIEAFAMTHNLTKLAG